MDSFYVARVLFAACSSPYLAYAEVETMSADVDMTSGSRRERNYENRMRQSNGGCKSEKDHSILEESVF